MDVDENAHADLVRLFDKMIVYLVGFRPIHRISNIFRRGELRGRFSRFCSRMLAS